MLTYNLDEVAHDRAANNNQSSARLGGGCLTYLRRGPFYDFSEDEVNDDFNSSDPKVESRAGAVLLPHRVPQSQSIHVELPKTDSCHNDTQKTPLTPVHSPVCNLEHPKKAQDNIRNDRGSFQHLTIDPPAELRAMKAEIPNTSNLFQPQENDSGQDQTNIGHTPCNDMEAQVIQTLYKTKKMPFGEIAAHLNRDRVSRGEAPTFTAQSVYAHFVLMMTRTATTVHEMGFDPKDYMHLRNLKQFSSGDSKTVTSKAGRKRVKDYDNATEFKANIRRTFYKAKGGVKNDLESMSRSEQLIQAVTRVERNFWVLVADEMERATTRLYEPEKLKKRYHEI